MGLTGVTHAFSDVKVYQKLIKVDHLPTALNGLRILHISDSHLSRYVPIDTIATTLEQAEPFAPDLIVLTGDIADDLSMLGETLKLISELRPRFGTYACLGNHEYYRGIAEVRRIFDRSTVPLLENQSVLIDVDSIALRVAGIDDPRHVGGGDRIFFKNAIDSMLSEAESAEFTILLSHRPAALDYASEVNLNLILAGHTHGGQIGAGERSFFELVSPESYLWGHYQKAESHLYTSSGVGHWFPFRLGCPAEAPIIEISSK
jgi:predicted MPP superfamily phosphohydrolase